MSNSSRFLSASTKSGSSRRRASKRRASSGRQTLMHEKLERRELLAGVFLNPTSDELTIFGDAGGIGVVFGNGGWWGTHIFVG